MQPPDQPQPNPSGYWLACGLVAVAHLATEIAIGEQHGQTIFVLTRFLLIGLPIAFICRRSMRQAWQPNAATTLLALLAVALPLVIEPLWRWLLQSGHAFEIQLLIGFRNLSLLSLVWAHVARFERLAMFTSLFAVLFCVSTSQDTSMGWICWVYLIGGITWLSTTYWSLLRTDRISGHTLVSPWRTITMGALLTIGVLFTVALPASMRLRMVEGFMPSSGGTGEADPYARSGVGDGDALVAATEEARTFAPIEEAPFLEGEQPSLYDVFQDTYSPPKPPKGFERAVSLPPEVFKHNHQRMAQARKASRSFSVDREQKRKKRNQGLEDTESNALLHLAGPVPAHLRVTVYDLFDGTEWYPAENRDLHLRSLQVKEIADKPWITWAERPYPIERVKQERHALRILNVDTNRVLAPVNLNGVHIDRCDRPDLFEWAQEDVLAMDRSALPPMTVIHVISTLLDTNELTRRQSVLGFGLEEYRTLPEGPGMKEIRELALEWTQHATCGWEKVSAITHRLRTDYRHNPDVRVPDGCTNPVHWFLTESREGPDYLFATASVMLCRSIGITSRAVSGLYAGPSQFDYSTGQTSVRADDAHWWAEIYVGSQAWVTIEPTPGYEVRKFPQGLLAQVGTVILQFGRLSTTYWPVTLCLIGLITAGVRNHAAIITVCQAWFWNWRYRRSISSPVQLRRMLLDTGQLLDRKFRLARMPRPTCQTMAQFVGNLEALDEVPSEDRALLSRAFDWAAYCESESPPDRLHAPKLQEICRSLLHLRRITPSSRNIQA